MLKIEEIKISFSEIGKEDYNELMRLMTKYKDYFTYLYAMEKTLLKEKYSLQNNIQNIKKEKLVDYMDYYIQLIEASCLLDILEAMTVLDNIIQN